MNLVIDLGNTAYKLGIFDKKNLIGKRTFAKKEELAMRTWIEQHTTERLATIVSSVVINELDYTQLPIAKLIHANVNIQLPVRVAYENPQSLGIDRLANACGAWSLNPAKPSLVIDLGTCIKYDLVDQTGKYLGGAISPGLAMRFRSLHEFTDKLPLLSEETDYSTIGTSTSASMALGVKGGIEHEINGFIKRYKDEFEGLTIFMTGGDASYFDKAFKNAIFANPDLTLIGLNEILLLNQS